MLLSVLLSARLAWPADHLGLEVDPTDPRDVPVFAPAIEHRPAGQGVVGGDAVQSGVWDDAVGIVFDSAYVGCTGTLIGPEVVLTAGHCVTDDPITHVLVGSKNWISDQGEVIEVDQVFEYPNSQRSYDVALVTLRRPSTYPPRAIGLDCILRDHLDDGAAVQIVGFGSTSERGDDYYNTRLNAVGTTVSDTDCDQDTIDGIRSGCQPSVSPGGEIAAGGGGEDACFGDSGGPLYLETAVGAFVIGVTSRAYLGADREFPCRDGGIWVRPDAVVDWIDDTARGKAIIYPSCNDAPQPEAADILTTAGVQGSTELLINDPDGDDAAAKIEMAVAPEHGTVTLAGLLLQYLPEAGFVGDDRFTLRITDGGTGDPRTGAPVSVDVEVGAKVLAAPIEEEAAALGCGCGSSTAPSAWGAALVGLALLRRRSGR